MKYKKGNSLLEVRRNNRICIKDVIYQKGPITRTSIAEELELTLPTITTSVNEMIKEKIIEELPIADDVHTVGRRPQAIRFRADAACAIGVELGPYATNIVLMNLGGEILEYAVTSVASENYQIMLNEVARGVKEIIKKAEPQNLTGVGIGLPGFIESEKGIIRSNFRADWSGKHFSKDLETLVGLPVIIDNNVRLRAVGYEMSYKGERPDSFAYFYISKGIACPIMVKDYVLTGYTSGAGEVGHMIVCVQDSKGNIEQRIVEAFAGEDAILGRCRNYLEEGLAEELGGICKEAGELTMKQVLQAQKAEDTDVCFIMKESAEYLGIALANVVNLINPDFVVIDGYMMKNEENRRMVQQAAKRNFFGLNEEDVKLVFQPYEQLFGAKGASAVVIRRLFLEK